MVEGSAVALAAIPCRKRSGSEPRLSGSAMEAETFGNAPSAERIPREVQTTMNARSRDGHEGEAASYDCYYTKRSLYWSFNVTGKVRSFVRLCRSFGVPMAHRRVLEVGFGSGGMLLKFSP